ncbi:MAG: 23S rRNA (adenine(2503)-C(2))-methyltransferase RlmN [Anaerolineaceae bacterium]|jgi:23S rRNA (adenine2503-C2)-methyltransferase|nr:MAG: 23S rRNA (adenine(2503)-C(2))-methyltransferase RlmN [Anaerolineaceae bacterium]
MKCILDLNKEQLQPYFQSIKQPDFRWKQVWHGLYVSYLDAWQKFSVLPLELREQLAQDFSISPLQEIDSINSPDGFTKKVLFQLPGGNPLESVLMRYDDRVSICISSQSGCSIGCEFCATGKLGWKQDLSSGEIVAQILYFAKELTEDQQKITNIVIMGMGEPFLNYAQIKKAILTMNDHDGLNIGSRRITVSTIGIPQQIIQFAQDFPQVNLAVSLHASTDEQRNKLIPINRKFTIEDILTALKQYISITNRRVTFEYVLIADFNDSVEDALRLGKLLQGFLCHVNLIPLNSTAHFNRKPSSREKTEVFQKILNDHHIPATIRFSKGTRIQAGCGQLTGKLS